MKYIPIFQEKFIKKSLKICQNLTSDTFVNSAYSQIFFQSAEIAAIDATQMPMFNRAEPISLNDGFYEILIGLQIQGVYIQPNPALNQKLGDKLAVKAIHNREKIGDLDLLAGVETANQENRISFETGLESISAEKFGPNKLAQFYERLQDNLDQNFIDLLEQENFSTALSLLYPDQRLTRNFSGEIIGELQKIYQGTKRCQEHHNQFGQDTILKPADYFGGCGVKRMQGEVTILEIMQGIFVRVNPQFAQTGVGNISQGGHPESLFNGYSLNHAGVDEMITDMIKSGLNQESDEVRRAQALYGLLDKIEFIQKLEVFKQYPMIGADALLTKNKDGSYSYGINEINLTSPAGQTALMVFDLVYEHQELATKILQDAGIIDQGAVRHC